MATDETPPVAEYLALLDEVHALIDNFDGKVPAALG